VLNPSHSQYITAVEGNKSGFGRVGNYDHYEPISARSLDVKTINMKSAHNVMALLHSTSMVITKLAPVALDRTVALAMHSKTRGEELSLIPAVFLPLAVDFAIIDILFRRSSLSRR